MTTAKKTTRAKVKPAANGRALCIGLNSVDPNHYQGWVGTLIACEADANDMADIANSQHFQNVNVLLTQSATRANVLGNLKTAALASKPGDLFMLSYSGHGAQLPDLDGDEDDGMDETWALFDGELIDDELYAALADFQQGVRILVLSDSCNSGTVTKSAYYTNRGQAQSRFPSPETFPNLTTEVAYRTMPLSIALQTYRANRSLYDPLLNKPKGRKVKSDIQASCLLVSGCQDNQLSQDGTFNGLFTGTLLRKWNAGKFNGNYRDFHHSILSAMPPDQSPNYFWASAADHKFEQQAPFTV